MVSDSCHGVRSVALRSTVRADPSVDLAVFIGCFGAAAFDNVLGRFERAGGRGWPELSAHARERWFASPALAADWALRVGSDAALAHARAHLAAMDVAEDTDTSSR